MLHAPNEAITQLLSVWLELLIMGAPVGWSLSWRDVSRWSAIPIQIYKFILESSNNSIIIAHINWQVRLYIPFTLLIMESTRFPKSSTANVLISCNGTILMCNGNSNHTLFSNIRSVCIGTNVCKQFSQWMYHWWNWRNRKQLSQIPSGCHQCCPKLCCCQWRWKPVQFYAQNCMIMNEK